MRRFALAAALAALCMPAYAAGPRVGINPAPVNDWNRDGLYADALKHSRPFATGYGQSGSAPTPVDAQGWPTGYATMLCSTVTGPASAGRYTVRLTGWLPPAPNADTNGGPAVGFYSKGATVFAQNYDAARNRTTILIDVAADNGGLWLSLRGAKRNPADATQTGFTDLSIMRPVAPGAVESHQPEELFSRPALAAFRGFGVVRDLDLSEANTIPTAADGTAPAVTWPARRLPSAPIQSSWAGSDGIQRGIAVEHRIALANAIGADLWACWPDTADDDYKRKFCLACRYGTDGVNPYTSDQALPVWPPLKGKLVIEQSNELWNDASFQQAGRALAKAKAVQAATPGDLDYDGSTNPYYWRARLAAKLAAANQVVADGVWPGGLRSQYDVVLSGFQLQPQTTVGEGLNYLKAKGTRAVDGSISLAGCGWYRSPKVATLDATTTAASVVAGGLDDASGYIGGLATVLAPYPTIAQADYEGGAYFGPDDSSTPQTEAIQADPAFGTLVTAAINQHAAAGASTLVIYGSSQPPWGQWQQPGPSTKRDASLAAAATLNAPPDTVQARIDAAGAARAASDAAAKAVADAQAKAAVAADAAARAAAAVRDGLNAVGKPAVGKAPDGSPTILTPTDAGYESAPAVESSAPIPTPKAA